MFIKKIPKNKNKPEKLLFLNASKHKDGFLILNFNIW